MRIIHITDLHLPSEAGTLVNGVDTIGRLSRLMEHLKKQAADMLVITGDISGLEENEFCYGQLKELLSDVSYPWVVIPGNHDRGALFGEAFVSNSVNGLKILEKGEVSIIFFDTSSETPDQQCLGELERYLSASGRTNYLFTHYPPVSIGHPSYDHKHRLQWQEKFLDVLKKCTSPLHVFFGHVHFEFKKNMDNINMCSTPSATIPSIRGNGRDHPDQRGVCYREIVAAKGGCKMELRYV